MHRVLSLFPADLLSRPVPYAMYYDDTLQLPTGWVTNRRQHFLLWTKLSMSSPSSERRQEYLIDSKIITKKLFWVGILGDHTEQPPSSAKKALLYLKENKPFKENI